jgi:ATP-dependent protease ClpP protease subunit
MATFLIYHGPVCAVGARNVETLCMAKTSVGASRLTLCLCSGGGDVIAGIGLFNFLKMLPITVNTHCFGICGSIAATIFLAGERRTTAPASMFSLHAATYSDGARKGQISENTKLIADPFETILGWQKDRLDACFGSAEETFLPPAKAKELGIVHEIEQHSFAACDDVVNVSIPAPPLPRNS